MVDTIAITPLLKSIGRRWFNYIAMVRYLDDTANRGWTPKDNKALVRGVQDVPELSL